MSVGTDDTDPRLPSVTGVYPTANFHEREVYDFFGVEFEGHPNLQRILMPDDWLGHPTARTTRSVASTWTTRTTSSSRRPTSATCGRWSNERAPRAGLRHSPSSDFAELAGDPGDEIFVEGADWETSSTPSTTRPSR
jgi:hypothetical protein